MKSLLQLLEEKELSDKQKKIAKLDPPVDKLDAGDFKKLRAGKNKSISEDQFSMNKKAQTVAQASEEVKKVCREAASILGIDNIDDAIITNQTADFDFTVEHESGKFEVQDVSYTRSHEGEVRIVVPNSADIYIPIENSITETQDHEVSMAQSSLKAIVSAASELMNKIGSEEIDLPGWIQDHITNAENYINQANKGYHELGQDESSEVSLTTMMERMKKNGYK